MTIFCMENLSNSSKRCKFVGVALKEAFSSCRACKRRCLSYPDSDSEEDMSVSEFDDLQELVVSIIRARAIEAKFRKNNSMMTNNEVNTTRPENPEKSKKEEEIMEDFASAKSRFSPCLSVATDSEAFYSAKTELSCCMSIKDAGDLTENGVWWLEGLLDSSELKRRAIIQQVCHCQGWPFGLCRKVLLLPPLPKSPSDSWTWCKGSTKFIKTC